jgi:GntR family histidine utilization transcriptional repressor
LTAQQINGWQSIQQEVLRRIHSREWPPGRVIPNEVDLAAEFGCARATVNRALQALAESGVLERRRKFGTRVALHPVSRATLEIPLIRQEIEAIGNGYEYSLLLDEDCPAPRWAGELPPGRYRHVRALHNSGGAPFVIENRWISLETVTGVAEVCFQETSANEWLLSHVPYTHGEITFLATPAKTEDAAYLGCASGSPLFSIRRLTWDHERPVTAVQLYYAPGYEMKTQIGA